MSNDPQITLTPSEFVGAVKQGLSELHNYLNATPVYDINVPVCQAHLERMFMLMAKVAEGQPRAANGAYDGAQQQAQAS